MEQEQNRVIRDARQPGSEQRKHTRVRVSWRAQIASSTGAIEARVVDVAEQGLGLMCDHAIPKGMLVDVVVAIPDLSGKHLTQTVSVQAQIMFTHFAAGQCRLGTQFTRVSATTQALIVQHVEAGKPA